MKILTRSTMFVLAVTAFVFVDTEGANAQSKASHRPAARSRHRQLNRSQTDKVGSRVFQDALQANQDLEPDKSGYVGVTDLDSPATFSSQQDEEVFRSSVQSSYQQDNHDQGDQYLAGSESGGDAACDFSYEGSSCYSRPWWAHRSRVFGEFLYLQASDADVTHAQQQNGTGGAGTVPFGRIGRADPDYEPAFRVGIDVAISDKSSLFFSYTQFESSTSDFLDIPNITGGGGSVGSFVHHPGASIIGSTGPVSANYDIDFQLADFGVRRVWKAGSHHVINWSLGGRYGHLEQDFLQSGVFAGGSAGQIDTRTNVDFDGGGLRFGVDGERRFGCRGFSLYAKANVSPMVGTIQSDYTMRNASTGPSGVLLANAIWKDDRIVTVLDYEAGINWTSPCEKWRMAVGYNAAHWFNMVTTDSFISSVKANNYEDVSGPLTFSGLIARVERRF